MSFYIALLIGAHCVLQPNGCVLERCSSGAKPGMQKARREGTAVSSIRRLQLTCRNRAFEIDFSHQLANQPCAAKPHLNDSAYADSTLWSCAAHVPAGCVCMRNSII